MLRNVRKVCSFSSLLLYRGNGRICSPLSHLSRGPQDQVCLYGASTPINPAAQISKKEKSNVSLSLWFLEGKAMGEGREEKTGWQGCLMFLLCVSCFCNPYPAVLTNSAILAKQTTIQMSNTIYYKWLKADKNVLKWKVFDSIFWR